MRDRITLNSKQQKRVQVLGWLEGGKLTVWEAATVLGLSGRQVMRLRAAYRREGVRAVVHGNLGRRPAHAVPEGVRHQVDVLSRGEPPVRRRGVRGRPRKAR